MFPAVFGFSCYFLLGGYSIIYTVVNSLWCIVFVEYWKRKEVDLSCRWQTKGVSAVQTKSRQFKPEKEVRDEITGEMRGVFSATKRMQRQLLQIPFAILAAIALGAIIATCFAIEIFISELYNGPLKSYLVSLTFSPGELRFLILLDFHSDDSGVRIGADHECRVDVHCHQTQRLRESRDERWL